eukprot:5557161-Pleurochrysis_carterae.AAC.1
MVVFALMSASAVSTWACSGGLGGMSSRDSSQERPCAPKETRLDGRVGRRAPRTAQSLESETKEPSDWKTARLNATRILSSKSVKGKAFSTVMA